MQYRNSVCMETFQEVAGKPVWNKWYENAGLWNKKKGNSLFREGTNDCKKTPFRQFSLRFLYVFLQFRDAFKSCWRILNINLSWMIFRSAEKTFFFSAGCGKNICPMARRQVETGVGKCVNRPLFLYLEVGSCRNQDGTMRGGASLGLTCFSLVCALYVSFLCKK